MSLQHFVTLNIPDYNYRKIYGFLAYYLISFLSYMLSRGFTLQSVLGEIVQILKEVTHLDICRIRVFDKRLPSARVYRKALRIL